MMMMMMIMFVLLMVMLTICDSQMVDKFVFSLTLDMQFKVHDIIICSNMFQIMLSKVGPNLYVFLLGFQEGVPAEVREAFSASNSGAMLGTAPFPFNLALAFPAGASGCFPDRRRELVGSMMLAND